jgi:hypothetical protein
MTKSIHFLLDFREEIVVVWSSLSKRVVFSSVIIPGPARQVDPGPGPVRATQKTSVGKKPT